MTTTITTTVGRVEVGVELPRLVNFLKIPNAETGIRYVRIEEVSDAGLRMIGNAWTDALIKRAQEKREPSTRVRLIAPDDGGAP